MAKFDADEQERGSGVMRPAGVCGAVGCGEKSAFRLARVESPNGSRTLSVASTVMNGWHMRPGYMFCGWHERCANHASQEQAERDREHWERDHPPHDFNVAECRFGRDYPDIFDRASFLRHFGAERMSDVIFSIGR